MDACTSGGWNSYYKSGGQEFESSSGAPSTLLANHHFQIIANSPQTISLRFSLRNSRKISCTGRAAEPRMQSAFVMRRISPLPSVEMRQRWLQRKWFALLRFRAALAGEASLDEAAQRAKSAASFKGGMRTLGARLMDHRLAPGSSAQRVVAQRRGAIGGDSPANFVRAARGWQHGVPVGVLTPPADAQTTTSFLDPSAADAFRQFHRGAATLRVVSRTRNLAMSAGQRRPKIKRPVQL